MRAAQLFNGRGTTSASPIGPTNHDAVPHATGASATDASSKDGESSKAKELLGIHHLITQYGNIQAIKGISIYIDKGEIVALIGANGAGKSTTLLSVSGVLTPTSGTIRFNGQNISGLPSHQIVRQGIAQVVEGRAILAGLTVLENLMLGAYIRSDRNAIEQDMDRMFDRFPRLRERSGQIAGTLSGGEQQMLAIARA
ncbi:MAG: ATP-binding cassette domain-containing protein, partial [Pusillimonas sp.]